MGFLDRVFGRKGNSTTLDIGAQPVPAGVTPYQEPKAPVTLSDVPLEAIPILIARLRDLPYSQNQAKRREVAAVLLRHGAASVEPLISLLRDPEAAGHAGAAELLGTFKDERAVDALGETLLHRHGRRGVVYDEDAQLAAAAALAAIGSAAAVPYLQQALSLKYDWDAGSRSHMEKLQRVVRQSLLHLDPGQHEAVLQAQRRQEEAEAAMKAEEDTQRVLARESVSGMAEQELIAALRAICERWAANEVSEELSNRAVAIGEVLYQTGGVPAMKRAFAALNNIRGARALEMNWDGIGDWRG